MPFKAGSPCPRCGGRLRLVATIDDPRAIREILTSLALPTEGADRAPPPVTRIELVAAPTEICGPSGEDPLLSYEARKRSGRYQRHRFEIAFGGRALDGLGGILVEFLINSGALNAPTVSG